MRLRGWNLREGKGRVVGGGGRQLYNAYTIIITLTVVVALPPATKLHEYLL